MPVEPEYWVPLRSIPYPMTYPPQPIYPQPLIPRHGTLYTGDIGNPDGWSFVGGLVLGAFIIAPFIWTGLGRALVGATARKGTRRVRSKTSRYLK